MFSDGFLHAHDFQIVQGLKAKFVFFRRVQALTAAVDEHGLQHAIFIRVAGERGLLGNIGTVKEIISITHKRVMT